MKDEFSRHGELLTLMLRYTQALITQIAQTAVCNRHHSIASRSRWERSRSRATPCASRRPWAMCSTTPVLPTVFDLFVQAEQSLDRPQGGLGVGLTLVRHVVEGHGGRVAAYSDGPGQGSEFVLRWPARVAGGPPATDPAAAVAARREGLASAEAGPRQGAQERG